MEKEMHVLVVTIAAQGQINPARHLADRITRISRARVTIAVPLSAYRRMLKGRGEETLRDRLVSYASYSDGFDDGFDANTGDHDHFMSQLGLAGPPSLSRLVSHLAACGKPITCIVYTLATSLAAGVAKDIGVPSFLFWIQPASVFSVYYHYFHGYFDVSSSPVELPGIPPLQSGHLPSFITSSNAVLDEFRHICQILDEEENPRVLVNTFHSLEANVIAGVKGIKNIEFFTIGPFVDRVGTSAVRDLFDKDSKKYMEWLDLKAEGSVVYVSFGSLLAFSQRQIQEMARGLAASRRPFLWVLRKDNEREFKFELEDGEFGGMKVEWCEQARVLAHRAVGCFMTHCGWNSMSESLSFGVPMVMVPKWNDQPLNARLGEAAWKVGVRAVVDEEGVAAAEEVRRCLDVVMGEGEEGVEIRSRAGMWRKKAEEELSEGGLSYQNLKSFLELI